MCPALLTSLARASIWLGQNPSTCWMVWRGCPQEHSGVIPGTPISNNHVLRPEIWQSPHISGPCHISTLASSTNLLSKWVRVGAALPPVTPISFSTPPGTHLQFPQFGRVPGSGPLAGLAWVLPCDLPSYLQSPCLSPLPFRCSYLVGPPSIIMSFSFDTNNPVNSLSSSLRVEDPLSSPHSDPQTVVVSPSSDTQNTHLPFQLSSDTWTKIVCSVVALINRCLMMALVVTASERDTSISQHNRSWR